MPRTPSVPSYGPHRPSGQAVVTVRTADGSRRDVYLGLYNSPESRAEYARIIAETASGSAVNVAPGARLTVDEMLLAFFKHAAAHYRRPDGSHTGQLEGFKHAAKPLHRLYGHVPAADFGPLALRTVRQFYIDSGDARSTVNLRVGMVRQIFKWAASHELIPATVHAALKTVSGLEEGRTEAPEPEPVGPAPDADVEAVLPTSTAKFGASSCSSVSRARDLAKRATCARWTSTGQARCGCSNPRCTKLATTARRG
jgi:hypothetical protein